MFSTNLLPLFPSQLCLKKKANNLEKYRKGAHTHTPVQSQQNFNLPLFSQRERKEKNRTEKKRKREKGEKQRHSFFLVFEDSFFVKMFDSSTPYSLEVSQIPLTFPSFSGKSTTTQMLKSLHLLFQYFQTQLS